MPRISLLELAHQHIKDRLRSGAIAIDATVGNGHDTVFLVDCIKPSGQVYGFDIQKEAIDSAAAKTGMPDCLTLIQASHAAMGEKIPSEHHGNISACMFNLGYLPGGDKSIITQTATTVAALTAAAELLAGDGIITVLAYPGHPGGAEETVAVKQWCQRLGSERFKVMIIDSDTSHPTAPKLFIVSKTLGNHSAYTV